MKFKALFIAIFFIAAIFSGSAWAAEKEGYSSDPSKSKSMTGTTGGAADSKSGTMTRSGEGMKSDDMQKSLHQSGMHKAGDLIGQSVVSQQGQELGSIDNLVVSESGQVEYIILSRGGVVGMGDKLFPIPWQAANLQMSQDDKVTASITEEQLQNAPSFEGENWAQIGSDEYKQQVHSYFGSEPQSPSTGTGTMKK
ncbi:MAG: PRC-barrel domain containing protein [Desulfobacteraceae bacterium]|nr:MAG: PRC-barrel domain containing protein [Desulfobacteraceae bacterium]